MDYSHTHGRNRDERRTVSVFDPAEDLAGTPWQFYVAAIIQVERKVFTRNPATGLLRRTTETAFYVCNQPVAAERAATAIRAHWGIENTSHYARDVTLGGGPLPYPHQTWRVRPFTQLRVQHQQSQSLRNHEPRPLPGSPRRHRKPASVQRRDTALNSPDWGADFYAGIRSVIGTAKRRGIDAYQAINATLRGQTGLQPG